MILLLNCAGRVGGIMDNSKYQDEYLFINTLIGLNLVNMSFKYRVKKLINLGSACIYPKKISNQLKKIIYYHQISNLLMKVML